MAKSADAFRTISEVAEWLGVQTHVLRFWESKFTQVKPVKRAGGRRYYRPADMLLLGGIRKLLHEDGLTIKGVQKILREEGMAYVADLSPPLDAETDAQLDADLTARMDEDVTPPPVEAEVVPFASTPPAVQGATSDDTAADTESVAAAEPEAPLPSFLRTPTPPPDAVNTEEDAAAGLPFPPMVEDVPVPTEDDRSEVDGAQDDPAPDEVPANALPAFMRSEPPTATTEATPAQEEAPESTTAEPQQADAPSHGLPSFLSDYAPDAVAPDKAESDEVVTSTDEPAPPTPLPDDPVAEDESGVAVDETAAAPVPRVIDVPDDPDPDIIAVAPSALSKAARLTQLTDAQRNVIRPLLAQLTALRDQMASNRREPR
ncbi:MerR family transcriptional regulator [uncultured Tateyamaria sp.]|uniref:MerR family transcriptional regulator n=1 Tax=uncultured Tateyamaria sp. TaxID=455651 RepID=UPI00262541F1|nr:MerR family transcriptional regulator [uncultured Tateyamaria sp.]